MFYFISHIKHDTAAVYTQWKKKKNLTIFVGGSIHFVHFVPVPLSHARKVVLYGPGVSMIHDASLFIITVDEMELSKLNILLRFYSEFDI